ncbi:GerAB/ArcD/ProY family transporter [Alicyclobacillus dauci]|uniref:Spore germination protein n=1 Tax=Alicyclobacillus dauci TaxID=1475485 RepID=A0ABY6Z7M6_9BACL|nr:GerAB/ArcD/ProY family transporter [Alicyclobacillus dauci]WAH38895.1 spore germination protein [Alicyclobacillus dauci]
MTLRTTISVFQTIALCSSSYFPVVFWFFPSIAVEHAKFDAQWSVLLVAIVGVGIAWLYGALNERFPNITGADVHVMVSGRWLGKVILVAYIPVYLLFLALSLYFTVNLMKYFFPDTPQAVFAIFICVVGWRGAWLGIEALGRVASIVHPLTFAGLIASFVMVYFRAERHLIPHQLVNTMNVVQATYHLLPLYLGMNLFVMLSPYYNHAKRKSIWYPIISAIIGGVVLCIVFLSTVINLGWEPITKVMYPLQMTIQLIRLQGFLIERLGIVILILSVAFGTLFVSNHIWALSTVVARILDRTDDAYKPFTPLVVVLMFLGYTFIRNPVQARELVEDYLTPVSVILLIVVPGLELLIAKIRGMRTDRASQSTRQKNQT